MSSPLSNAYSKSFDNASFVFHISIHIKLEPTPLLAFRRLTLEKYRMSSKAFDASDLIFKTMHDVLDKTKTWFLYGCMLTKLFEFY